MQLRDGVGGRVPHGRDGTDADNLVSRVERAGHEASIDGGHDERLELAGVFETQFADEVVIAKAGTVGGEGDEGQVAKLGGLDVGEWRKW